MQGTSVSGNALAGGLAGAMVSVCIHPIDTIKTIVQSNRGASQGMGSAVMRVVAQKGERQGGTRAGACEGPRVPRCDW